MLLKAELQKQGDKYLCPYCSNCSNDPDGTASAKAATYISVQSLRHHLRSRHASQTCIVDVTEELSVRHPLRNWLALHGPQQGIAAAVAAAAATAALQSTAADGGAPAAASQAYSTARLYAVQDIAEGTAIATAEMTFARTEAGSVRSLLIFSQQHHTDQQQGVDHLPGSRSITVVSRRQVSMQSW